jgi:uncharacterized SAM-binding protein YcdF (DUF218 family)
MNKKIFVLFPISLLLIFATYIIYLLIIFPWNPIQLVYSQNPEQSDAIVVLEGEQYTRIDYALKLLDQGYSKMLIFPGLQLKPNGEHIQAWLEKNPNKAEVIIGTGTTSTYEEAIATKRIIISKHFKKIILVTSSYHSYRASWIFRKVLPHIKVLSVPVPLGSEWFSLSKAKTDRFHKNVIKDEQTKFFGYFMLYGWRCY